MSDLKYLDIKELLSNGFLFEINRRILHPHGMALEVTIDDDGTAHLSGIWDYRDDTEGITFGDDLIEIGTKKFEEYMEKTGNKKLKARKEALGYVVQGEK